MSEFHVSEGVMSYMQKTKERNKRTFFSLYVEGKSGLSEPSSNAVDKESPRRTIIELKRLLVDGVDKHSVVLASVAASSKTFKRKSRTKYNAAKSDGCSARCKLAHENEANCCAGTGATMSPSTSSMTPETVNKTMPSAIKKNSVKSNNTQCDSNDCDDDLCAEATAATDDEDDNDTNNEENAEQKVSARISISSIFSEFSCWILCRDA